LGTVQAAVDALATDPDVRLERVGDVLPVAVANAPLAPTRTVAVQLEGVRTIVYAEHPTAAALAAAMNAGDIRLVQASVPAGSETRLPDLGATYLVNGRDAGLARDYAGRNNPAPSVVLTLIPAPDSDGPTTRFQVRTGTAANTVRIQAGQELGGVFTQREDWDNLTMDPDDPGYLPDVLRGSALLRAVDAYTRSRSTTFPRETLVPAPFANGRMPQLAAFTDALDLLESEDAVDLVLGGLQGWKDAAFNGLAFQQAMLAHSITQADAARPRIALGSVSPGENLDVRGILDHARQVGNRRFVLVTPAGAEGAVAGLLGHLEYFQSPTFKTIAAPGVPLVRYSEAELNQLVGPQGNLCVVTERRGRGVLCVKGIATDGFQISVTRVADRCVREVNAIANKFIGELNNADARNALKQMIVATFTQMERDGALVPSVDGKSPAFVVDVYASQNDTAAGIVRVDIAVRPVRAIDYVYATIRVKN
ncbi:MAG TPA: phage tail sheath C-terminal domain-containing protein, partial [Myxococcota bacterium]|nr:phage tail sheath C-terminal domain-containing protein [Myxococcota bacterium]